MALNMLAIDVGKHSFHIFGIDEDGLVVSRKISRAKLVDTVGRKRSRIVFLKFNVAPNPRNRLHDQHPLTTRFESKRESLQRLHFRGSILDADPPAQGSKLHAETHNGSSAHGALRLDLGKAG